ncbi:class I tRNA ligase family protein, partial [Candidatus Berkelbacteria bacterium]|nr:class I tRNA ligase family protein [Candidatus Berkelbacteria bacterium]
VIWPALLLAAGRPLPKKIFVHGFFTIVGQKISKSLKNVIDPLELTAKFGNDALRYFLLREFSFGEDGDFSLEKLKNRYRNELANDLGNLVQRVLTLVKKDNLKATHKKVKIPLRIEELISDLKFKEALDEIWLLVNKANRAIDQEKPWALEKRKRANFLSKLLEQISIIAESLAPFLPETSREIKTQIKTLKIKPLFPKQ